MAPHGEYGPLSQTHSELGFGSSYDLHLELEFKKQNEQMNKYTTRCLSLVIEGSREIKTCASLPSDSLPQYP